jgi:peptide/nickel transport system permease protein
VARYVLLRLLVAVPLALGAASLVFVLLETAPGNAADLLLGDRPVPPEVRERLVRAWGLDRPAGERYVRWVAALALHGELGWSISRSRPVAELVADALPATARLAVAALTLHLIAGVLLGALSAASRGRLLPRALGAGSLLLYSMPTFWLGLMAVMLLSYAVPILPASSMRSVGAADWPLGLRLADAAWHLVLPAAVLACGSAAAMIRVVRAGVVGALGQGFARAARARGVGPRRVLFVHALRNALLPVINLAGLSLPALLSGTLVAEVVFAWPGMGRLTYDAIRARDIPVVLATTVLATFLVVAGSLAADLAMAAADPRIRLDGRKGRS